MSIPIPYPRVYVVILNWTRPFCTLASMRSLAESDYPCLQVVVVDNGSADESPTLIRRQFPQAVVIENHRNLGFAGGSNVGISYAMQNGADYVLLLNDDAEVASGMVRALVQVGESDPRMGILGPKIYYYDWPDVIWSAGGSITGDGQPCHLCMDEIDDGALETVRDVDYVTGCVMLVKRGVVERVGALDERFFAYFEETEWCARALRNGYRVVCVPQAKAWHKVPLEYRPTSAKYIYLMTRNRLLYLRCIGASPTEIIAAALDIVRGVVSRQLRVRDAKVDTHPAAVLRGMRDFTLGRFRSPPSRL